MKRSVLKFDNQNVTHSQEINSDIRYREICAPASYSAAKEYKSSRTGAS